MSIDHPRLLLVEDSPADVELVQEVLQEIEFDVALTIQNDGTEALDYLTEVKSQGKENLPHLVLLDLDLPKMDGYEFLEAIGEDENLDQLPVVVLTMSNADQDIGEAFRKQANACITKPLGFEEFKEVLAAIKKFWFEFGNFPPFLANNQP